MTYKVRHLQRANRDVANLADILAEHKRMAQRIFQEMELKIKQLEENPFMWAVYHANPKYRCIILENNMLFYTVDEARREVVIHRVVYAGMDISKQLDD